MPGCAKRLAAVLCGALSAAGCSDGAVVVHLGGVTMGTTYNIKYVPAESTEREVRDAVEGCLAEVNRLFSLWIEDSEISGFNAHRSEQPFEVDDRFVEVVRPALELAARSGGAFDPTVLPVLRLYGFAPGGERREPTDAEIAAALEHVGFGRIEIDALGRLVKLDPLLELDPNAFAKGAGVDLVSSLLVELGCPDHMVEIGGEVMCRGKKPGGEDWLIGVERPAGEQGAPPLQTTVALADRALATSGDYRNRFESEGRRTHHIVDPRTGRNPAGAPVSVSVIADRCALADALATALMVVGPEGAPELLAAYPGEDLRVLFLVRGADGRVEERSFGW